MPHKGTSLTIHRKQQLQRLAALYQSKFWWEWIKWSPFHRGIIFLVQNVSLHDEGEYICEGFNEHGRIGWGALLVVEKGDFLFF